MTEYVFILTISVFWNLNKIGYESHNWYPQNLHHFLCQKKCLASIYVANMIIFIHIRLFIKIPLNIHKIHHSSRLKNKNHNILSVNAKAFDHIQHPFVINSENWGQRGTSSARQRLPTKPYSSHSTSQWEASASPARRAGPCQLRGLHRSKPLPNVPVLCWVLCYRMVISTAAPVPLSPPQSLSHFDPLERRGSDFCWGSGAFPGL